MRGLAMILVVVLFAACGDDDAQPRLTIWAAASLTDVLPKVADAWREGGNEGEVLFSFDGSSRLARQIEAGAPADVFVSADDRWMDYLEERARIVESTRRVLVENELVVVVPASSDAPPERPEDLAGDRFARIALATEEVPAGRYAAAALAHHHLDDALGSRIVRGNDVRAALAYVAAGEADAGIVYRTDAIAEPRVREAFAFSGESHPPIVYPAAVTRHAASAELARRFLEFCQGDEATRIFRDAGFEVR